MSRYSTGSSQRHSVQSAPAIVLYDIPGPSASQSWAPNIWRIRFILNFKRLAYRTTWIEFPEVETTMRVIGAPPSGTRPDGRPIYTLPVIVDPTVNPASPIIISNANNIAEYLDAAYPARPVFPEGSRAVQTLFVHYIQEVFIKPLLPILVPVSHRRLPERTQSHFRTSGGSSSNEAERPHAMPAGPQREHAWRAVQEQFDFLHIILSKNVGDGDGIVTMGYDVSYADFALCSILLWIHRVEPRDGWTRVRTWNDGRWFLLWERCKPYMDEL